MDVPFILKQGNGKRTEGFIVRKDSAAKENNGNSEENKTEEA